MEVNIPRYVYGLFLAVFQADTLYLAYGDDS
jgi:hypothetical protein